jgi:hypothetical protein
LPVQSTISLPFINLMRWQNVETISVTTSV